jgi:hypothetical protein
MSLYEKRWLEDWPPRMADCHWKLRVYLCDCRLCLGIYAAAGEGVGRFGAVRGSFRFDDGLLCRGDRALSAAVSAAVSRNAAPAVALVGGGLALGFLHGFGEGGDDFKEVADDAVVGDIEDGRVGILIDGDDRLRALHADQVLNGA